MALHNELHIGSSAINRPYIPSLAASDQLIGEPKVLSQTIGTYIANRQIAGASNGGLVSLAGEPWGVDFVAAHFTGRQVIVEPTDKSFVQVNNPEDGIGLVVGEGAIILTNRETGLMVISGIVTACRWTAEDAVVTGERVFQHDGSFVIQPCFANRAEVNNVDSSGEIEATLL